MASQSLEILSARPLPSNYVQPIEEVVDLGAYKQLNIAVRILGVNANATLRVEHSATKEEGAFVPIPGLSATAATQGIIFISSDAFLRYIRVSVDTFVSGSDPVASVMAIAKE